MMDAKIGFQLKPGINKIKKMNKNIIKQLSMIKMMKNK
jgi:hypothetical protein